MRIPLREDVARQKKAGPGGITLILARAMSNTPSAHCRDGVPKAVEIQEDETKFEQA